MKLRELKTWINNLPEPFDEYSVVNGEVGIIDEQYHYRVDKPLTTLMVDENSHEIILMNDGEIDPLDIDAPNDKEIDDIIESLKNQPMTPEMRSEIEKDTWGKGLPVYVVENEWLIAQYADGTSVPLKPLVTQ